MYIQEIKILDQYEHGYALIRLSSGSKIYVSSREQLVKMLKDLNKDI